MQCGRVGNVLVFEKYLQANCNQRIGGTEFALAPTRYRRKLTALPKTVPRSRMSECAVCFEDFTRARTRSVWPCFHSICRECDRRMITSGLHRCPVCRTPREGFNESEAARAAQNQSGHAGRNYGVVFFANEASGARPYDALQAFAEQIAPGVRTRIAARRNVGVEIAERDGLGEGERATRRLRVEHGDVESAGDFLARDDTGMAVLIQELLQPGTVDEFLTLRESLRLAPIS